MKGTIFQKPLEFNLRIQGESWNQGDIIQGSLVVKNHGPEITLGDVGVHLALGHLKKVRLKSPEGFKILSTIPLGSHQVLPTQGELSFDWTLPTDRNCSITDSLGSLFLLYGQGSSGEKLGQLQLPVHPYWVIQDFLKIFQISFRFVLKSCKSNKDRVELKLVPPESKVFVFLEQLVLLFHFEDEILHVQYSYHLKKVEASAAKVDLTKHKKEFEQAYRPDQYLLPSGRLNHDLLEEGIRDALGEVESKIRY